MAPFSVEALGAGAPSVGGRADATVLAPGRAGAIQAGGSAEAVRAGADVAAVALRGAEAPVAAGRIAHN